MAPKYKLTYFDIKGLAESIRWLLSYLGVDFEDNRISREQWAELKSSTPFGKVPLLEEDGKQLTQSVAICRYLGTKAGIHGTDPLECLQIDIAADTLLDMRLPISQFFREENEEVKKTKKETYIKETLPFYLKKLEAIVKADGYLANKKLSWVDILFTSVCEFLSFVADVKDVTADYPSLHALQEKVLSLPKIKKWIASRPVTDY